MMNIAKQSKVLNSKRFNQLKETVRRFRKNKLAVLGVIVISLFVLLIIFSGVFGTYDEAIEQNISQKLLPPSKQYWFGTDNYGRDVFLRCVYGTRISLLIGLSATVFASIAGLFFGMTAGYYGGVYDSLVMRFFDLLSAIPTILLAICIVAFLGTSTANLIVALTVTRIARMARISRASVLSLNGQEFIEAAHAGGTSDTRILIRHFLPNIMGPVLVNATGNISRVILNTANLSFLGLGVGAPAPEWGAIISSGKAFLRTNPNLVFLPGFFIIAATLSITLIGDGLRDALDPRLKS